MLAYVYDGSFDGLLTSIFEAYRRKEQPGLVLSRISLQYSLLDEYVFIESDPAKADRVYSSIGRDISYEALQHVYNVFLSEDPGCGTKIYKYLSLGWQVGRKLDLYLSDDRVLDVHSISQRVGHEVHKMMGFVRFRLVDGGIYYASICPDNNIAELLAPHFAERLADQKWIIHDTRRDIAALFNGMEWFISDFTVDDLPADTKEETEYQKLWKEFFRTLSIPSRENPKLQRQLMPRRYWKNLIEKT